MLQLLNSWIFIHWTVAFALFDMQRIILVQVIDEWAAATPIFARQFINYKRNDIKHWFSFCALSRSHALAGRRLNFVFTRLHIVLHESNICAVRNIADLRAADKTSLNAAYSWLCDEGHCKTFLIRKLLSKTIMLQGEEDCIYRSECIKWGYRAQTNLYFGEMSCYSQRKG